MILRIKIMKPIFLMLKFYTRWVIPTELKGKSYKQWLLSAIFITICFCFYRKMCASLAKGTATAIKKISRTINVLIFQLSMQSAILMAHWYYKSSVKFPRDTRNENYYHWTSRHSFPFSFNYLPSCIIKVSVILRKFIQILVEFLVLKASFEYKISYFLSHSASDFLTWHHLEII